MKFPTIPQLSRGWPFAGAFSAGLMTGLALHTHAWAAAIPGGCAIVWAILAYIAHRKEMPELSELKGMGEDLRQKLEELQRDGVTIHVVRHSSDPRSTMN